MRRSLIIVLLPLMLASLHFGLARATVYEIIHHGNVGATVFYQVVAPVDVKIGESFSVQIDFTANEEIRAYDFNIWIHGAGVDWSDDPAPNQWDIISEGGISRTVTVTATERGAVWCDIVLGFYVYYGLPQENFYFASTGFGICMPRFKTYDELQFDYNDLEDEYDYLEHEYESLNTNYQSLQTDYNQYTETHSHSDSEYNSLQSSHNTLNGELNIAKTLNYVMVATTVVFIASTIYFARRKLKTG